MNGQVVTAQVNLPLRSAAIVGRPRIEVRAPATDQSVLNVIRQTGEYEPHVMDALTSKLPEGGVFIDVGANIGVLAVLGAFRVGQHGRVLAFEASPVTCQVLAESLAHNGFKHAEALNYGVWDHPTTLTFAHIPNGPGWSSFAPRSEAEQSQSFQVQCEPLDVLVEAANLNRLDLIKVDIEGGEINALQGAKSTIERFKPSMIVEFSPIAIKQVSRDRDVGELYQCVRDYGYGMSVITRDSQLLPTTDYADLMGRFNAQNVWLDILCEYQG